VLQVVDVYDALTTDRPYKKACSVTHALQTMKEEVAKGWWDPHIFEQFERLVSSSAGDVVSRGTAAGVKGWSCWLDQEAITKAG
jgi:HD-GYP domain-containing protein (c-di-GMP phosphodiesterase class II)